MPCYVYIYIYEQLVILYHNLYNILYTMARKRNTRVGVETDSSPQYANGRVLKKVIAKKPGGHKILNSNQIKENNFNVI